MSSKPPDQPFKLTDMSTLFGANQIQSIMSTPSREDSVYLAKLAEQAERYEGESL
jgi:hypothetical protein